MFSQNYRVFHSDYLDFFLSPHPPTPPQTGAPQQTGEGGGDTFAGTLGDVLVDLMYLKCR